MNHLRPAIVMLLGAVLLLVLGACNGEEAEVSGDEASAGPTAGLIRGHYLFAHEVRALLPCGEAEDLWVIDRSGKLKEIHEDLVGRQGEVRISVIATGTVGPPPPEGFGAGYPGSVTVDEVLYAAREGIGCDFDLSGFLFRAMGNEPFWMVEIQPGAMVLTRPGSPVITWPGYEVETRQDDLVFRGVGAAGEGILSIVPGPGHDAMSGAYFAFKARFKMAGETFDGLALKGFPPAQEGAAGE
jgi:uncharacterized membrane protein